MKRAIKASDYQDTGRMTMESNPGYISTLKRRITLLRKIYDGIEDLDDNAYETLRSYIQSSDSISEAVSDLLRENVSEYERLTGKQA